MKLSRGKRYIQLTIFAFRFFIDLVFRILGISRVSTTKWERMLSDWPRRSLVAAEKILLTGCDDVLDVGAGKATLGSTLGSLGFLGTYKPIDLYKRDERFGVIDLRANVFPEFKFSMHAYVGVLEYLKDPGRALDWSFINSSYLLICYVPMKKHSLIGKSLSRLHRWTLYWECNYDENEILNRIQKAGFEIMSTEKDQFGFWINARKPSQSH
jgi:hypothetical protein